MDDVKKWVEIEQSEGIEALEPNHRWKQYSQATKNAAVHDRVVNKMSLSAAAKKYQISSRSVLQKWVDQYTNGKEIKATSKGRSRMKQG